MVTQIFYFLLLLLVEGLSSLKHEQKTCITSTPTTEIGLRLTKTTIPTHYCLEIDPHLDEEIFSFDGKASIKFQVIRPTKIVMLHSSELLTIQKKYTQLVLPNGKYRKPIMQRYNSKYEIFSIHFFARLSRGQYTMKLKWTGREAVDRRGFYRSRVTSDSRSNHSGFMATTFFEPTAARRAFPCWDEPGLKAEFEISLKHQPDHVALSNMPAKSVVLAGDKHMTIFEKSPPMSTYLISFFVAEYDRMENEFGNLTFWAKFDALDDVEYAYNISQVALSAMESYTAIPYALPKLDLVSVPDFNYYGMEHWGMISYKESTIRYNSTKSILWRNFVKRISMHEVIHQWFGNLVTPDWWEDVWLNEAFASYLSYRLEDMISEKMDGINLFQHEVVNQIALKDNGWYQGQYPIRWKPEILEDIQKILSSPMTVHKGSAVLHMLENILSPEIFQNGLKRYLEKYKYKAVKTDDLWEVLQDIYDENTEDLPGLNIKTTMDPWMHQKGYPIVNISRDQNYGIIILTQNDGVDINSGNRWTIPITYTTESQPNFEDTKPTHWLLETGENLTLTIDPNDWIILNFQQTGFYRVNYDDRNWMRLIDYLNTNDYHKIHVKNRAQLLWDLHYYSHREDKYLMTAVNMMMYLQHEIHYLPWIPGLLMYEYFHHKTFYTPSYKLFRETALFLISNITYHIGYGRNDDDDHALAFVRYLILPWACSLGHEGCVHAASKSLTAYLENPTKNPISNDEEHWIYCGSLMAANSTFVEQILSSSLTHPGINPGIKYLGCTKNRRLVKKYLTLAVEVTVPEPIEFISNALTSLLSSTQDYFNCAFDFIIENIAKLTGVYHEKKEDEGLDNLIDQLSQQINHRSQYKKFQRFLKNQRITKSRKILNIDKLLNNAKHSMSTSKKISKTIYQVMKKNNKKISHIKSY